MRRFTGIGAASSAAVIAALVLLTAAPADAHNYLVASTPAEGATLTELPDRFSVSTNDTLLDLAGDGGGFAIHITDEAGQYFGDGCFIIRDESLSTSATLGEAGDYLMQWQLVSADGHTVSGEIGFTWQPDANQMISEGLHAPPACGGGTRDEVPPTDETAPSDDRNTTIATTIDASTVVFIAAAIALVLVTGVAIFLIAVKRNKSNG